MVIEAVKIGAQVGTSIGVFGMARDVLPKLIPETASIATKVCYGLAGAGVVAAVTSASEDYIEGLFDGLEESVVKVKTTPVVREILKKEQEKLVEAESEEEIIAIIKEARVAVNKVKEEAKEEAKLEKELRKQRREDKKNLGPLYRKAKKKLKNLNVEDRK